MKRREIGENHSINPIPHCIVPLDFNNMPELPESHVWCHSSADNKSLISVEKFVIPVIDMMDSNAIPLMKKACEELGMFQIINHGIKLELCQQVEDQSSKIFSLPSEQKLQALRSKDSIIGYGIVKISPFFTKLMWSEGFTIHGSPLELARSLWPQECNDSATFCNVFDEYQEAINGLSQKIFCMLLMSLGLNLDDLEWSRQNSCTSSICSQPALQLNCYPTCPEPSKAMGLAPHSDSSLLTLLYQNNTTGLQLLHDKEGWITVQPIAGALVVNVGDLFHILSNGIFKSPLHRVMVSQARRLTAAFFFGPPREVQFAPVMKLVEPDKLPLYRPVTWKEYLDLRALYFDKTLDHLRLDRVKAEI